MLTGQSRFGDFSPLHVVRSERAQSFRANGSRLSRDPKKSVGNQTHNIKNLHP